jgi:hypothetical protein
MLEILLVIHLCRRIGARLQKKGRPSGWYKLFVVVAWFGGELAGGFVGGIASALINGPDEESALLPVYLAALAGAGLCTAFVFFLASQVPDARGPQPAAAGPEGAMPQPVRETGNPYQAPR